MRAIAVDATDVVWADNAGIQRAPKDGSGTGTLLATQSFATNSLIIVGSIIYFGSPGNGLNVLPNTGGTPTQVPGGSMFANLATDGTLVFTLEPGIGGLFSLPLSGGTATQLPTVASDPLHAAQCFGNAVLDGANLYVGCIVNMATLRMFAVPTNGASTTSWQTTFYPAAVNSTLVVGEVSTGGTSDSILGVSKATMGAPTTFIQNAVVADLHIDDTNLYYLDGFTSQGVLFTEPLSRQTRRRRLSLGGGSCPKNSRWTPHYLYFDDAAGRIVRISK